jgi:hypothetical protein
MSFSALIAAVVLAAARLSMVPDLTDAGTLFALVVVALVVIRHRGNLTRLASGTEPRLGGLNRLQRATPAAHALALGLWCGAGWFFSLGVAPRMFATFDALVKESPAWLPLTDDSAKDLGSRLAGYAVGPAFSPYFALQAVCGLVAAGTALGWSLVDRGRWARARAVMLPLALALVAAGWPVVERVSAVRFARYDPNPQAARQAQADFALWHTVSLLLNLAALGLATPALALAAYPPRFDEEAPSPPGASGGL